MLSIFVPLVYERSEDEYHVLRCGLENTLPRTHICSGQQEGTQGPPPSHILQRVGHDHEAP